MSRLIAKRDIILRDRMYRVGEVLPSGTGLEEAWIAAGSAEDPVQYLEQKAKEKHVKAKRAALKAGLEGDMVINAEEPVSLVGQIPKTEKRRTGDEKL